MNISLNLNVFDLVTEKADSTEQKQNIFALFHLLNSDRHWLLSNQKSSTQHADFQSIKEKTNGETWKELRELYFILFAYWELQEIEDFFSPQPNNSSFIVDVNSDNLAVIIPYLQQPLGILVENKFNDRYFVEAIIKHFGEDFTQRAWENKWIILEHAGGSSQMDLFIGGASDEANEIQNGLKPRLFVLMDSDKTFDEDKEDNDLEAFCSHISNFNFDEQVHILHKREMENYLPLDLIEELATNENYNIYGRGKENNLLSYNNFLSAFKKLNKKQQDYFDMEKGFKFTKVETETFINYQSLKDFYKKYNDAHPTNKPKIIKDYSTQLLNSIETKDIGTKDTPNAASFTNSKMEDTDKDNLQSGFGLFFKTKKEFPKLFKKATKEQLETRCAHHPDQNNGKNELQIIADKIKNLL